MLNKTEIVLGLSLLGVYLLCSDWNSAVGQDLLPSGTPSGTSSNAASSSLSVKAKAEKSKFSNSMSVGYSQSIISDEDNFHSKDLSFSMSTSYKGALKTTYGLVLAAVKELDGFRDTYASTGYLYASRSLADFFDERLNLNLTARGYMPVNRENAEFTSFQGAAYVRPSLSWIALKDMFLIESLSLSTSLAYRYNFYEFDENDYLFSNTQQSASASYGLGWSPHRKWSVSASYSQTRSWLAGGTPTDDTFYHSESISYQADPRFSVSVGHELQDRAFNYQQTRNNVSFVDANRSRVFTSMGVKF